MSNKTINEFAENLTPAYSDHLITQAGDTAAGLTSKVTPQNIFKIVGINFDEITNNLTIKPLTTGRIILQPTTDNSSAIKILNASGTDIAYVDTIRSNIIWDSYAGVISDTEGFLFATTSSKLDYGIKIWNIGSAVNANAQVSLYNNVSGCVQLYAANSNLTTSPFAGGKVGVRSRASKDLVLCAETSNSIIFATNNVERMRLSNTAALLNIGRASDTGSGALNVKGIGSNAQIALYASDSDSYLTTIFTTPSSGNTMFMNNTNKFMFGGGSGFGVLNPTSNLIPQLALIYTSDKYVLFTVDVTHSLTIKPTSTGVIKLQPTTDSTNFFQILNAAGSGIVNVDTVNKRFGINTTSTVNAIFEVLSSTSEIVSAFKSTNASGSGAGVGQLYFVDDGAAMDIGDRLAYIEFGGAKNATHDISYPAVFEVHAEELWTDTSTPTFFSFFTCPSGTTSRQERLRISGDGSISVFGNNLYIGSGTPATIQRITFNGANDGKIEWDGTNDRFVITNNIRWNGGYNLIFDSSTGTKIGTATNQLMGFYGATPVDQPATVADAATQDLTGADTVDKTKLEADLSSCKTAINALIDRLQELGLIA